jgi:hypothetical protein
MFMFNVRDHKFYRHKEGESERKELRDFTMCKVEGLSVCPCNYCSQDQTAV